MKYFLTLAIIFAVPYFTFAALNNPYQVFQGGTGITTLTGLAKGNGTSAFTAAVNGTDYTLITAKTCSSGDFVSSVTAAGVFTCTTPTGTTYTGIFPISVSGTTISFGGISTSSPGITSGQPLYATGVNTIASVASSTFLTSIGGQTAGNYITALTGDVTASGPGSAAATLATVNSSVGSFGSATQTGTFTVNGKGLVTAASNVTITPALSSITGFGTGWATTLGNNVGASSTVLTSNGTNGVWQTIATGGITAIGPTGQTQTGPTITLATSSTPFNGLTASTTITGSGNTLTFANTMAGLLGVGGGGTGQSSYTTGDLLYASGSSALSKLGIGTGGYVLAVSGGLPTWVATSSITGAVSSVSNSDSSLTISPTTGAVVASLNTANPNTWSALQQFNGGATTTALTVNGVASSTRYYAASFATDPTYSFSGDPTTGIADNNGGAIDFMVAGVQSFDISNHAFYSGNTRGPFVNRSTGTVSAPVYAFNDGSGSGIPTTGLWSQYTGALNLTSGGTEVIRSDTASTSIATGNFGVASTSPTYRLSVGTGSSATYVTSGGEAVGYDLTKAWSGRITPTRNLVLNTGTTTTWTGTTTGGFIPGTVATFAGTLRDIRCKLDASFLGVNVQINGSNVSPSYFVASSTAGVITFTGSNTFSAGDTISANVGTTSTASATSVRCTAEATETP